MSQSSKAALSPRLGGGTALWVVGLLSFGLVVVVLVGLFIGLATAKIPVPKAAATLHLVKDVSLPSAAIPPAGHAPIQSLPADGFDFQAIDPRTGLLFITHAGPSANKQALIRNQLPPGTRFQSQLVVFDTKKQAVIGHIAIPNVHGVTVAPDLGRVYAADVTDHQVDVIDERSLRIIATIPLGLLPCSLAPCETPDALEYDAVDHRIFVSGNGTDNAHQDISVIDVRINRLIDILPLGQDQFGDSIGHPQYDPSSHRLYVAVQPQPKPAPAVPTPGPGTPAPTAAPVVFPPAQFLTIDPVSLQVLKRVAFNPKTCTDPHGLVVDSTQHVAFTACTVTHTLMMIDLQSMKLSGPWPVVLKPDILRLDPGLHRLYVPGSTGVSIFDEQAAAAKGTVQKVGDFVVSKGTSHTMAFNPSTHLLYFAVQDNQGRAVERIEQNP